MSVKVKEVVARTILTPQTVGSLATAFDYSLNPYAGCAFACSYCYVPKFPNANHEVSEWGQWVNVKTNAAELLANERQKIYGSRIFFSSATDPYQYIELKYHLSRKCLAILQRYQPAKVTMHTRSHLILKDLELLKSFGDRLQVGVSITTDCDDIRKEFEPNAPSIGRRIELIKALSEAGITVHASLSPLLPCNADRLISLITPYVKKIWIDEMRSLEVNTKPELLQKHAAFFDKLNYAATIEYISSAFNYYTGYRAQASSGHRKIAAYKAPRERARRETVRQCKLF